MVDGECAVCGVRARGLFGEDRAGGVWMMDDDVSRIVIEGE